MTKKVKIGRSSKSDKYVAVTSASKDRRTSVLESVGSDKGLPKAAATSVTVRDAKTGRFLTVKGAGALKGHSFAIKKGVDLTKPIAKQALRGSSKLAG